MTVYFQRFHHLCLATARAPCYNADEASNLFAPSGTESQTGAREGGNRVKKRIGFFIIFVLILSCLAVPAGAASLPAAGKVVTGTARLHVRVSPSVNSAILTRLEPETWVTVLGDGNGWTRICYDGDAEGYVKSDYLKLKDGSHLAYAETGGSRLNVRRGAGTGFEIKAKLDDGARVAVLSESGGWATVLFDGTRKGYVASRYLTLRQPQRTALNVPYYMQTDARWKNVPVGTKGGTIGSIGCTTTCLAMCESYRTGKAVTPDVMASRLQYQPGGSLYWPSNYRTELSGPDALQRTRAILESGKPVLFGAKKANGTQHWVVVTGCTGDTAAQFSIHDPASAKRTTLQDYLAIYPNYYKLAYYA